MRHTPGEAELRWNNAKRRSEEKVPPNHGSPPRLGLLARLMSTSGTNSTVENARGMKATAIGPMRSVVDLRAGELKGPRQVHQHENQKALDWGAPVDVVRCGPPTCATGVLRVSAAYRHL